MMTVEKFSTTAGFTHPRTTSHHLLATIFITSAGPAAYPPPTHAPRDFAHLPHSLAYLPAPHHCVASSQSAHHDRSQEAQYTGGRL